MRPCMKKLGFRDPVPEQPKGWWWYLLPPALEKIGTPLLRGWARTWRFELIGHEHMKRGRSAGSVLLATWHGHLGPGTYLLRDRNIHALVSPVWEAELIGAVLRGMGYGMVRASSGYRSSAGLLECKRKLQQGANIAVIVDGPEGPRKKAKPGIAALASFTGVPIVPVLGLGEPAIRFPSWDRHEWPLPFARCALGAAAPLMVPPGSGRRDIAEATREVERRLLELEKDMRQRLREG